MKKCDVLIYGIQLKASRCLVASVGVSAGLITYYYAKEKNKKGVVVTADDIYHYNGIDNVVIDVGGTDVILSITAEEMLRKILNRKEKSSLLYK